MRRDFYSASISEFVRTSSDEILGRLAANNPFSLETTQRYAWEKEISILKTILDERDGFISFEYSIPRMGKRIDVVLIIGSVIFVIEFKIDDQDFSSAAIDQVWDYALDLKNFHDMSYTPVIAPVLVATDATVFVALPLGTPDRDKVLRPICCNVDSLSDAIDQVLQSCEDDPKIDPLRWEEGRYCPTPTIIEAAQAL